MRWQAIDLSSFRGGLAGILLSEMGDDNFAFCRELTALEEGL